MKKGGEGGVFVNQESDKESCPEEHRDEGSLLISQEGFLSRLPRPCRGGSIATEEPLFIPDEECLS